MQITAQSASAFPGSTDSSVESVDLQRRHERVAVTQRRAPPMQQLEDIERRRLAHVADVLLVRHAEQVDLRSVDALLRRVERIGHPLDDELGHRAVDVAGQLDEAAFETALPRLP